VEHHRDHDNNIELKYLFLQNFHQLKVAFSEEVGHEECRKSLSDTIEESTSHVHFEPLFVLLCLFVAVLVADPCLIFRDVELGEQTTHDQDVNGEAINRFLSVDVIHLNREEMVSDNDK